MLIGTGDYFTNNSQPRSLKDKGLEKSYPFTIQREQPSMS